MKQILFYIPFFLTGTGVNFAIEKVSGTDIGIWGSIILGIALGMAASLGYILGRAERHG